LRIDPAAAGDSIDITRRGKPVARLTTVARPRKQVDAALLQGLHGGHASAGWARRRSGAIDAGWRSLSMLYLDTSPIVAALSTRL
jgi:antitoxin (DNA-binding transcriptional repressor) of toxin-antitoxin stability system